MFDVYRIEFLGPLTRDLAFAAYFAPIRRMENFLSRLKLARRAQLCKRALIRKFGVLFIRFHRQFYEDGATARGEKSPDN